ANAALAGVQTSTSSTPPEAQQPAPQSASAGATIANAVLGMVDAVTDRANIIAETSTDQIPPDTSVAGAVNGVKKGAWSAEQAWSYLLLGGLTEDQARNAFIMRDVDPPRGSTASWAPPAIQGYDSNVIATLYDAAAQAGFTGDALHRVVATALAESGGDCGAHNHKGEDSRGPLQVYVAMRHAYTISSGGTDFSPWSVWHDWAGKPAEAIYGQLAESGEPTAEGISAARAQEQRTRKEQALKDFREGRITEDQYNERIA